MKQHKIIKVLVLTLGIMSITGLNQLNTITRALLVNSSNMLEVSAGDTDATVTTGTVSYENVGDFYSYGDLTQVDIPESVVSIDGYAFDVYNPLIRLAIEYAKN